MGRSIFITGTDTGVGKTFFTSGVVRALREAGVDAVGFKPIECGGRVDSEALLDASGGNHNLDEINPIWLEKPLAPLAAADSPSDLPLHRISSSYEKLIKAHDLILVEGAGGWLVPVTEDRTMADLAAELCQEVVIVAANKLGVVSHTLLTWRSVTEMKFACDLVVLNHLPSAKDDASDESQSTNAATIQRCLPQIEVMQLEDERSVEHLAKQMLKEKRL